MRISDWSSDVCSSDLDLFNDPIRKNFSRRQVNASPSKILEKRQFLDLREALLRCLKQGHRALQLRDRARHVEAFDLALGDGHRRLERLQPLAFRIHLRQPRAEDGALVNQPVHPGAEVCKRLVHAGLKRRLIGGRQRRIVESSEEHTSELQSLMRISYDAFCLIKTKTHT